MNRRPLILAGVALLLAVVAANTFFIVDQRRQVVVVNLGDPVRVINPPDGPDQPGLYMKAPFVESLVSLDKRNQPIEAH